MSSTFCIRFQALCAILLTVVFYLTALVLGIGLFLVPMFELTQLHFISLRLTLFGLIGGFVLLSSIWPRRPKFEVPSQAFTLHTMPGEPVVFQRNEQQLQPFHLINELAEKHNSLAFLRAVEAAGLTDEPFLAGA